MMNSPPLRVTDEQVAAAQLRIVLDEKLGRQTPSVVRRIAAMKGIDLAEDATTSTPDAPLPLMPPRKPTHDKLEADPERAGQSGAPLFHPSKGIIGLLSTSAPPVILPVFSPETITTLRAAAEAMPGISPEVLDTLRVAAEAAPRVPPDFAVALLAAAEAAKDAIERASEQKPSQGTRRDRPASEEAPAQKPNGAT